MAISRNTTVTAIGALSIAVAIAGFQLETTRALAVPAPQGPMGNSAFLGAWCAQGDPTKHCSVSGNGVFLSFTNENGDTSTGHFVGMSQNVVSADQWNFVQGTLSGDGRTSTGRMAPTGQGAPAEVAIALLISTGRGIAAGTAHSPATSGRGKGIFSCATKAARARLAQWTGAAM